MEWVRGDRLGFGSFGTVDKAISTSKSGNFPLIMAVKTVQLGRDSVFLRKEKDVFDRLGLCPQIVGCFGDHYTTENNTEFYNLLLEFASKGTLADHVKNSGGRLSESDVKRYARSLLEGLNYIHGKGFVHCDIKPQNILLFHNDVIKIADFGLAKKAGEKIEGEDGRQFECRGTPLYMSPESVNENEYESPADIWALGCVIVEMFTGKPAWSNRKESNIFQLLIRIGVSDELPEIPNDLSDQGKDFLAKIFVKDATERWSAEKLLNHPFVANHVVPLKTDELPVSPKCPFEYPEWVSEQSFAESSDLCWISKSEFKAADSVWGFDSWTTCSNSSPEDRIRQMASDEMPNWALSSSWISVR